MRWLNEAARPPDPKQTGDEDHDGAAQNTKKPKKKKKKKPRGKPKADLEGEALLIGGGSWGVGGRPSNLEVLTYLGECAYHGEGTRKNRCDQARGTPFRFSFNKF